ncbi:MAG: hypothetical protein IJV31_06715 [Clostridia bacterium]|nr:hypothetical protein [Clostridia bacterium]
MKTNNNEQTKISKMFMKNCNIGIYANMVLAVIIMEFFMGLNLVFINCNQEIFQIFTKVAYMEFLILAIIFIEIAYKKEDTKTAVNAIEYLCLSTYLLLLQRIRNIFDFDMQNLIVVSSLVVSIYYTFKSILIDTSERREKLKNISDIKEIVKEEKPAKKLAKKRKV